MYFLYECSIKVTVLQALLEYLNLARSWYSYCFELDSSTPLEYASMLSNSTGTNSQIGHLSSLCATGAGNLYY